MQISTGIIVCQNTIIGLVWRLSKSVFLCGGFGRRTFGFWRKSMKETLASNDVYSGIYANTRYTPIPMREKLGEEFITEALDVSKLYQANIRIDRLDHKICVHLSFDFGVKMRNISRLLGMADGISFSKDCGEHDFTVCLDFYTHVVVKNGLAVAP